MSTVIWALPKISGGIISRTLLTSRSTPQPGALIVFSKFCPKNQATFQFIAFVVSIIYVKTNETELNRIIMVPRFVIEAVEIN